MSETPEQEPDDHVEIIRRRVIAEMTRQKLSQAALGRAADVNESIVSEWLRRKYKGVNADVAEKFQRWLQTLEDRSQQVGQLSVKAPGYLELPTAARVTNALAYAKMMPSMALLILGSGMGKTTAIRNFMATRSDVVKVTMRPRTRNTHNMLNEIGLTLGIQERNPVLLDRAIGERLKRDHIREPLLIVDEAQVLTDEAIDQLRYFLDEYGCGIVVSGNEGLFARFVKDAPQDGFGQIESRFGVHVRELQPTPADIAGLIEGWGVKDPEQIKILTGIARKPGALRLIRETMTLASSLAYGAGRPVSAADIRAAWHNRAGGRSL